MGVDGGFLCNYVGGGVLCVCVCACLELSLGAYIYFVTPSFACYPWLVVMLVTHKTFLTQGRQLIPYLRPFWHKYRHFTPEKWCSE